MKRLFSLKDNDGHILIGIPSKDGPLSFDKKEDAKTRRDELNNTKFGEYPWHVTPGPDHHNYKGKK